MFVEYGKGQNPRQISSNFRPKLKEKEKIQYHATVPLPVYYTKQTWRFYLLVFLNKSSACLFLQCKLVGIVLKPNSWTYNFVEVSGHNLKSFLHNVYITNQFQTTFARGQGGGVKSVSRGDCEQQGGIFFRLLSQLCSRIRPLDVVRCPPPPPNRYNPNIY